jgi:CRISPR/Cas system-associated exonuclease Cas4 (RecB family)
MAELDAVAMQQVIKTQGRLKQPAYQYALKSNMVASEERDTKHFHPSEICKKDWCPRSSWYKVKGYPEEVTSVPQFTTLNIFQTGHDIHNKWQHWLLLSGVLEEAEVAIYDEEHHLLGHADGIVSDAKGRAVLEIKSIGMGSLRLEEPEIFEKYSKKEITADEAWKAIRKPFETHLRQINLYMYVLGIHDGIVLYENKANQEVKEFEIKYQPELIESILATCHNLKKALELDTPPQRPTWLSSKESRTCKYCPYKTECWKDGSNQQVTTGEFTTATGVPQEVHTSTAPSGGDSEHPKSSGRVIRR